jgi:hypothetical protein
MRTRKFLAGAGLLALSLGAGLFLGCSHHSGQVSSGGCSSCGGGSVVAAGAPTSAVAATAAPASAMPAGSVTKTEAPLGRQTIPTSAQVVGGGMYGGQKTCPVTGKPLDPSGNAYAVTVKGQTIYVCCADCISKVQANPDLYLTRVAVERSSGAAAR